MYERQSLTEGQVSVNVTFERNFCCVVGASDTLIFSRKERILTI